MSVRDEARERYEAAMQRRQLAVEQWEQLGCPMLAEGGATGRAPVQHPLLKTINELDSLVDRLAKSVGVRSRSRQEPGRMSDVGDQLTEELSPAAKRRLKAVQ